MVARSRISGNNVSAALAFSLLKLANQGAQPYLPQNITIIGEAATANQPGLNTNPATVTSRKTGAQNYGYGSPIDSALRILFPAFGGGGTNLPVRVIALPQAPGAVAKTQTITPSGTATSNGTIALSVCGREELDAQNYNVNIVIGDTPATVSAKMVAAVNAVLGCPFKGSNAVVSGIIESSAFGSTLGNGYAVGDTGTIAGTSGTSATYAIGATLDGVLSTATVNNGGGSWAVNDTFVLAGGATGKVTAETAGVATTVAILTGASDYTVAEVVDATATGGSTGINLVINVATVKNGVPSEYAIINPGTGYSTSAGESTTATTGSGTGLTIAITAVYSTSTGSATFQTVWAGLTSNECNIVVDTNPNNLAIVPVTGMTFAVATTIAGSGTPSIASALAVMGNQWNTLIGNALGWVTTVTDALEEYNGVPDPINPTGLYAPLVWEPLFAFTGSLLDDPTAVTGVTARQNQVTMVNCPAPLSAGMSYEAMANMLVLWGNTAGTAPASDIIGGEYPDMPPIPVGSALPQMIDQAFRNYCVLGGSSTVNYRGTAGSGTYSVVDLITTYNVSGEFPPYYRYVRDLNVYMNMKFAQRLLEIANLFGKVLLADGVNSTAANVIQPSRWKTLVIGLINTFATLAFISTPKVSIASLAVNIDSGNPNELDYDYEVQISGTTRQVSATMRGGFYFGS